MQSESILYVWGADNEGQLGLGKNRGQTQFYQTPKICQYKIQFTQVSCGKDHTALLTQNGHVYTMGSNEFNKLGHQSKIQITAPQKIEQLNKVIQISCGYTHTACITQDGLLYAWGDNNYGQLGVKQTNQLINKIQLEKCQYVSCGNKHTLVLTQKDCYGFGLNENQQLGILGQKIIYEPNKIKLPLLQQCSAGNLFSSFLTQDGIVYICGQGFGNLQKLNYKSKFIKIDGKSTPAGLTQNNELIFFDLDESISNIKDFCMGDLIGISIGEKTHQWHYDPDQKRITQLKTVDQLNSKRIINFSAGNGHLICIEQKGSSFIDSVCSSTTTLRSKHEERSKSNYTEKQDSQRIHLLEKQLEEKDKIIAQLKIDQSKQLNQLQQKIRDLESQLKQKDTELQQIKLEMQRLTEERKNSDSDILQCQVQDEELDESLEECKPIKKQTTSYQTHNYHQSSLIQLQAYQPQVKSPIRTKQDFEDNLHQVCKTDQDRALKYQSFEKQKQKEVLNERPQSQVRPASSEKTNLSTIKSRLTDLQKNKEQLEQRMKQFEDKLRENKLYTK